MKIAVRGGHNPQATGASALINELTEDRKVKDAVIKYLRQAGHEVLDVTPGNCSVMDDLVYGVEKAESFGAELFISCHFDKAYDSYNGAIGHACWIYGENSSSKPIAQRIVNSVVNGTGFKNRGIRIDPNLYELRKNTCPAIIVETCFCEATEDVKIYREKGPDLIGKLIAEGITEKSIASSGPVETPSTPSVQKPVSELWKVSIQGDEVKALQRELNNQCGSNLTVDGYFGESTLNACITVREGARGNITRLIQQRLKNRGYSLSVDGCFGPGTTKAVKTLQDCFSLEQDGVVGKNTWKAMYGLSEGRF